MMFYGEKLKLIRTSLGMSLDDLAKSINTSRQFVHSLESNQKSPSAQILAQLCIFLGVRADFFSTLYPSDISLERVHFRKLRSTPQSMQHRLIARVEIINEIVKLLEQKVDFPKVNFPFHPSDDIEITAEYCRNEWGLSSGPISSMVLLAEKNGAIVLNNASSIEIDALSVNLDRPIILRCMSKLSPCRHRFDIAHEIGHLVLHQGIQTGDKITESEANRYASALLLPRKAMVNFFPRPINNRINWKAISEFKLKWKVSKAAIFYRAHQLKLITDAQYKTAIITLRTKGESINENEDKYIKDEQPSLLPRAIKLIDQDLDWISSMLNISSKALSDILGVQVDKQENIEKKIISFEEAKANL